jgi:hypothetical protein
MGTYGDDEGNHPTSCAQGVLDAGVGGETLTAPSFCVPVLASAFDVRAE